MLKNPEGEVTIQVGDRVRVMFANRIYIGVISSTDAIPTISSEKIQPILSIEADMERILPQEIELWKAVSEYYLCSIGEVYKAAYPAQKTDMEAAKAISERSRRQREENKRKELSEKAALRIARIENRLVRLKNSLERARKEERKASLAEEIADAEKKIEEIRSQISETSEESFNNGSKSIAVISKEEEKVRLTEAQEKAYAKIQEEFRDGRPVLLHGVTGSGKTEIYIRLAQEAMEKGRNVLYLVPEIALSRQLEERLRKYFPDSLMTFHSGETAASRRSTAERIRRAAKEDCIGKGYIVLGTRSSLFLPHNGLGLIIVDEEHDSSYKQDSPAPRYNGRDTALMLSRLHNSNIILGSATPSLEELYNCRVGKHCAVRLEERYHNGEDAAIEIIDTKAERRKRGMTGSFSRKLIAHMEETLKRKEQIIILRSRRAWAPILQCTSCGEIQKCPYCNVSLNLHKSSYEERMTCHYCGYSVRYTGRCSKCTGSLSPLGAGTQKIEEEVAQLFPEAVIARLDSDTAQSKSFETKTIRDFSNGDIDILIGTQIVTKGFDFSGLTLVAVIAADTLLGIQDFRADEKAIQILEQFRGRSGRRGRKGLFVIQTSQPEHPVYRRLSGQDSSSFADTLLMERKDFGFPPYTRIVEISISDRFEDRAIRMSEKLADILKSSIKGKDMIDNPVTGPYAPAVDRIADRFIRTIRISFPKDRNTTAEKLRMKKMISGFEKTNSYSGHITINVDPA